MKTFPIPLNVMLEPADGSGRDGYWLRSTPWRIATLIAAKHGWDPDDRAGLLPEAVGRLVSVNEARGFADAVEAGVEAICRDEGDDGHDMRQVRHQWDALVRFCRAGAFRIVRCNHQD